jgi:magnesium transporter
MLTLLYNTGSDDPVHVQDQAVLPGLLTDKTRPFWLDLESPTPEEFKILSDVFHFHPLAVEDAMKPNQRPKVDEYDGYFFMTADEVTLQTSAASEAATPANVEEEDVQSRQLSMFLGENFLVTVHVKPVDAVRRLRDRCDRSRRLFEHGADYLLYTLLDELVDGYFPLLTTLDESMDDLQDRVVGRPDQGTLETIFHMKRTLTRLRRFAGPLREVCQTLITRDFTNIQPRTLPYLRDVADHLFRIYETLDSYRDLMSNMLDAYLSQVANEMNRVMQRLAVVGTVFLPITFLTGVFGMNFIDQPWAKTSFWFWLGAMGILAVLIYVWFRRHRMV